MLEHCVRSWSPGDDAAAGPAVIRQPEAAASEPVALSDLGFLRGALHEVFAADAGVATAFCALLAGRLARGGNFILWCGRPRVLDAGELYAPSLRGFGVDPERVLLVRARRDTDALWAMEEGLRSRGLAAAIGEVAELNLTAGRRLQLAAEAGGGAAIILRTDRGRPSPGAAATRWRIGEPPARTVDAPRGPAPPGLGAVQWRAKPFRCRGGAFRTIEWNDETGDFSVAAPVRDGPYTLPEPAG